MPKFLTIANYTAEGVRGLLKEGGTSRRATVEQAIAALGDKLECFYYAFGDNDAYVISDAPDNASAAAISLAVNSTGAVRATTIVLMTPEEMDDATKKTVSYRAPGQ